MKTLIMKFGGASVSKPESFSTVADLIIRRCDEYSHIVVVVSAMGNTTDELLDLAKKVHPSPPRREQDMLLSVGERISIALLAMALASKGKEAISFTGSQSGIITSREHSDARILDVRPKRILEQLNLGKIVIVAGFQGVSLSGEITTLGRGGSDTSAVALGIATKAKQVEFYKDVDGIYSEDPKINAHAEHFDDLSYSQALDIVNRGAKILHARAIELAAKNNIPLYIRSFFQNTKQGTWIRLNSSPARSSESIYEGEEMHVS